MSQSLPYYHLDIQTPIPLGKKKPGTQDMCRAFQAISRLTHLKAPLSTEVSLTIKSHPFKVLPFLKLEDLFQLQLNDELVDRSLTMLTIDFCQYTPYPMAIIKPTKVHLRLQ